MPAHKLGFYLNASSSLRVLTEEAKKLALLQQVVLAATPPELARSCTVKHLRAGVLSLVADNPAIAAKLRQLVTRLLISYRNQGMEVTSIRIEVQVERTTHAPATTREPRRLSIETIENLERLSAEIEDQNLKQALTKLAAHGREGRS